ncbi:MAG TPA: hypothetical protein VMM76_20820 [Pirellulaceae bacterium]|nr:hypothetical protein [Pirellulaceae bacterium]
MRFALFGLAAAVMLAAAGCDHRNLAKNSCSSCQSDSGGCAGHEGHGGHGYAGYAHGGHGNGGHGNGGHAHGGHGSGSGGGGPIGNYLGTPGPTPVGYLPQGYMMDAGPSGPPTATYGYPYYTTRAPRDFLMDNPPSIGY